MSKRSAKQLKKQLRPGSGKGAEPKVKQSEIKELRKRAKAKDSSPEQQHDAQKVLATLRNSTIDKRPCLNCERPFRPVQTISGVTTEHYCSPVCAKAAMNRRLGITPPTSRMIPSFSPKDAPGHAVVAADVVNHPTTSVRANKITEHRSDEALMARFGPKRPVKSVLREAAGSKRCLLECGHEATVPLTMTWGRCKKCLKEGEA